MAQAEYGNRVISELANKNGEFISPANDIPLWVDKVNAVAHMVVEIPRGTHPKLEMHTTAPLAPIKQDVKKGALRKIHDAYPFNYGAFSQTWENPAFVDPRTGAKGSAVWRTGDVITVKILGCWAMIDEGETDWKILAINTADENAAKYNDIGDVPEEVKTRVFTFLRDYKIPSGSGPNQFAFNSELQPKKLAVEVTQLTHDHWHEAIVGAVSNETPKGTLDIGVTQPIHGAKVNYTQEQAQKFFRDQESYKFSNL